MPDPTQSRRLVEVVDVHVGGDLHRIVLGGVAPLPGATVFQKMTHLRDTADGLRKLLLQEPRGGHPALYADLVVEPDDPRADAGFIIMELMGYPVISGTNTISTAVALLDSGRLPMVEGPNLVKLQAPGALLEITAHCACGRVTGVSYQALTPSFLYDRGLSVEIEGLGTVPFDLVWAGAFYPVISTSDAGIDLKEGAEPALVAFSHKFIAAARAKYRPIHPEFGDEGPLSFAIFAGEPRREGGSVHCPVCCFEYPRTSVCRSPAGTPTTAVFVQLYDRRLLQVGETLDAVSIFGTHLKATATEVVDYRGKQALQARVEGTGHVTARSTLVVDFADEMTPNEGLATVLDRQEA